LPMASLAQLFTFSCCHTEHTAAGADVETDLSHVTSEHQAVVLSPRAGPTCRETHEVPLPSLLSAAQPVAKSSWLASGAVGASGDSSAAAFGGSWQAAEESEFKACIRRSFPSEALGVQLDISDGRLLHLCAMKSHDCPIASYNKLSSESERLQAGDYIVQVNAVRGNSRAMMKEVQSSSEICFTVRRPFQFNVEIDKRGGQLGLGLNHVSKATSLVVEAVLPGPVQAWNDAHPEFAVKKGDRIVSVNNTSGQAEGTQALLRDLAQEASELLLVLTRPAGPEVLEPRPEEESSTPRKRDALELGAGGA